jgi:hypothetical protein
MDGFLKMARAGKPRALQAPKAKPQYDDDLPFGG